MLGVTATNLVVLEHVNELETLSLLLRTVVLAVMSQWKLAHVLSTKPVVISMNTVNGPQQTSLVM
jgi:hypothetical protein